MVTAPASATSDVAADVSIYCSIISTFVERGWWTLNDCNMWFPVEACRRHAKLRAGGVEEKTVQALEIEYED